jgi:hypothetical protein
VVGLKIAEDRDAAAVLVGAGAAGGDRVAREHEHEVGEPARRADARPESIGHGGLLWVGMGDAGRYVRASALS